MRDMTDVDRERLREEHEQMRHAAIEKARQTELDKAKVRFQNINSKIMDSELR